MQEFHSKTRNLLGHPRRETLRRLMVVCLNRSKLRRPTLAGVVHQADNLMLENPVTWIPLPSLIHMSQRPLPHQSHSNNSKGTRTRRTMENYRPHFHIDTLFKTRSQNRTCEVPGLPLEGQEMPARLVDLPYRRKTSN